MLDVEKITKVIKGDINSRNLNFQCTSWCNFKCSYCVQKNRKRPNEKPSLNSLIEHSKKFRKFADDVNSLYPVKYETINLLGGEISLFDMVSIVDPLVNQNCKSITLTTNGSANMTNYTDLISFCINRGIKLILVISYHEEFFDLTKFKQKVLQLHEYCKDIPVSLKVQHVLTNENTIIAKDLNNWCLSNGIQENVCIDRSLKFIKDTTVDTLNQLILYESKGISIEYDKSIIEISRYNLIKQFRNQNFIPKDYICRYKCNTLRYIVLYNKTLLKIQCSEIPYDYSLNDLIIHDEICKETHCNLCSNVFLEKV